MMFCIACILSELFFLFAPSMRHALDTEPHRKGFGIFFLLGALAVGAQLIWTTRKGYVYWHHTQTVMKASNPSLYRVWCVVQFLLVVMLTLIAVVLLR